MKNIFFSSACLALLIAPAASNATQTKGFQLKLSVPVNCSVNFSQNNVISSDGDNIPLGSFREYCNAASGYQLIVKYTPGTLRGARLLAGNDEITLNGSGEAVLTRSTQPRKRERSISVIPGEDGFNTNQLELYIIPN